jgi:hypothetical protein
MPALNRYVEKHCQSRVPTIQNKQDESNSHHDDGECEPSNSKVPPTTRCPVAPATSWNIAGFHGDLGLSARSTPERRHARLFSKDVSKIAARDRIYCRE